MIYFISNCFVGQESLIEPKLTQMSNSKQYIVLFVIILKSFFFPTIQAIFFWPILSSDVVHSRRFVSPPETQIIFSKLGQIWNFSKSTISETHDAYFQELHCIFVPILNDVPVHPTCQSNC